MTVLLACPSFAALGTGESPADQPREQGVERSREFLSLSLLLRIRQSSPIWLASQICQLCVLLLLARFYAFTLLRYIHSPHNETKRLMKITTKNSTTTSIRTGDDSWFKLLSQTTRARPLPHTYIGLYLVVIQTPNLLPISRSYERRFDVSSRQDNNHPHTFLSVDGKPGVICERFSETTINIVQLPHPLCHRAWRRTLRA